jgi:hypothetical protein
VIRMREFGAVERRTLPNVLAFEITFSAVPEPSGMLLMGLGIGGLSVVTWCRGTWTAALGRRADRNFRRHVASDDVR